MTLKQLLSNFQKKQLSLSVWDGQIVCTAPAGTVSHTEFLALTKHEQTLIDLISLIAPRPLPPIDAIDVRRVSYRTMEAEIDAGDLTPRAATVVALMLGHGWQGGSHR